MLMVWLVRNNLKDLECAEELLQVLNQKETNIMDVPLDIGTNRHWLIFCIQIIL